MKSSFILALFCLACLSGCSGTDSTGTKTSPVASVTLTAPESTIRVTRSVALSAKALDATGAVLTGFSFAWASSNNAIATVDANGVVRGIAPGAATITAVSAGTAGTFNLDVIRAPLAMITVILPTGELAIGKTMTAQAVGLDSTGKTATDASLEWKSTDPAILRVGASGFVTALAAGTARIEATAEGITGVSSITVLPLRFKAISAHGYHSCGLSIEGNVYCWGRNGLGTLGLGAPSTPPEACDAIDIAECRTSTPLLIAGEHVFAGLSYGSAWHTCAFGSEGAYCWGVGASGEIGNGGDSHAFVPTKVQSASSYTSMSVGDFTTCGVTTQHTVDCWGSNKEGQLGDPTVTQRCPRSTSNGVPISCSTLPRRVPGSIVFERVSLGYNHACALDQDGAAFCWGSNQYGALGSDTASATTPTPVATALRFTDITTGGNFTCALSREGRAYCWGGNTAGQSGSGHSSLREISPLPGMPPSDFVRVFAGGGSACGLDAAGVAFCWGNNREGQIGDGTLINRFTPTAVSGNLRFASLSLAEFHSCGITTDGISYCWGDNASRQLGIGRDGQALVPTRVAGQ